MFFVDFTLFFANFVVKVFNFINVSTGIYKETEKSEIY